MIGGLTGTLPIGHYYLLDMANGAVLKLDKATVEAIVAADPVLHDRFQRSKQSDADLRRFIEEYNQRHGNGAQ